MSKIDLTYYVDEIGKICNPTECETVVNLWHTYGDWFGYNENLPLPAKFSEYFAKLIDAKKKGSTGQTQFFLEFVEDCCGTPLERLFVVRIRKSKIESKLLRQEFGPEFARDNAKIQWTADVKEVMRRTEETSWLINCLQFCGMAGWRVDWPDKHKTSEYRRCSGYYYWGTECDDFVSRMKDPLDNVGVWRSFSPSVRDYMNVASLPPHFIVNKSCFHKGFDFFQYLKAFKEHPEIEMLAKNGLGYLWRDKKLMAAKPETKKAVIRFIKQNRSYIDESHPLFSEICLAIKGKCRTHEETLKYKDLVRTVNRMKKFGIDEATAKEIHKYLKEQEVRRFYYGNYTLGEYCDYLDLSLRIGRDIHDRGVLFPKSFMDQMEGLEKAVKDKESKEFTEMYQGRFLAFAIPDSMVLDEGFIIKPIFDPQELVDLGNHLHNCIGTGKYGEKVVTGCCLLFKIEHEGKPIRCVEIAVPGSHSEYGKTVYKRFTVLQNRGDHNQNTEYNEECTRLANGLVALLNKRPQQRQTA